MNGTGLSIFMLLLAGLTCVLWQKKRKFERTNSAGIEQFPKFIGKITGQIFDLLLQSIGYGLLLAGGMVWAMEYQTGWVSIFLVMLLGLLIEKDHYRSK